MKRLWQPLALAALLGAGCKLAQDLVYFPPGRPLVPCAEAEALGAQALDEEIGGQRLRAYVAKAGDKDRAFGIFFHGNAECACDRAGLLQGFASLGMRLALIEYPGYAGDKPGPNEERILANALLAYDRLSEMAGRLPMVLMGESLGSGPATYVAASRSAKALVLVSPYTSILETAKLRFSWLPVASLLKEIFPADEWAKGVKAPVFMSYGDKDWVVPTVLSMKQARNFTPHAQELVFKDTGHNVILDSGREEFFKGLAPFLDAALKP